MSLTCELRQRKGLLTVKEVAELLRCHVMTVYDWVAIGKLPHVRMGSRIKFDPHSIADWLEKRSS
jgi:excisionase family DNA binding protein